MSIITISLCSSKLTPLTAHDPLGIGTDTHSYAEPTVSVETVYLRPENQFLTTMPADTRPVIMATPTGTA